MIGRLTASLESSWSRVRGVPSILSMDCRQKWDKMDIGVYMCDVM